MSHAIVGLLDPDTSEKTKDLWRRIKKRHNVKGIWLVPFPHVSFHVANNYDVEKAKRILDRVSKEVTQVPVICDGFGFFTGPAPMFPVLFRPVARSSALSKIKSLVSVAVEDVTEGAARHYDDDVWKPHVTIASRDLNVSKLADVVEDLAADPVKEWTGVIDRLALILDNGHHELAHEVALPRMR